MDVIKKRGKFLLALVLVLSLTISCQSHASGSSGAKKIKLNKKTITMEKGKKTTLKVKSVSPKKASKKVTWKSSDKSIATVSKKGVVKAKRAGKVTITAKSLKGKASAKCKVTVTEKAQTPEEGNPEEKDPKEVTKMNVKVGDKKFTATLEKNQAAKEFVEMMRKKPVTIKMQDYSGFEKVGDIGKSLTAKDKKMTTKSGDIVLYSGDQIVVFYGSNTWSYTMLAKVDDLTGWKKALGKKDVTITFSVD